MAGSAVALEKKPMKSQPKFLETPNRAKSVYPVFKSCAKRVLGMVIGDYEIWRIYQRDLTTQEATDLSEYYKNGYEFREVSQAEIQASADDEIRSRAFYAGDDAYSYAVLRDGQIISVEFLWFGDRYRQRNFWPLEEKQAKAVETFTTAAYRGRGLATALKIFADGNLKKMGYTDLFSRVWYTNKSSCRMNEKAGWKNAALVATFKPFRLKWTVRLVHRL